MKLSNCQNRETAARHLYVMAALSFLIQSCDTTVLYLALPAIAHGVQQPTSAMDILILSYLAAVVIATPFSDYLMTRWGESRVYAGAAGIFMLAAVGCAGTDSLTMLCLWRLLQGGGGAIMLATARVMLLKTAPESERVKQMNRATTIGLLGTLLGPMLGGIVLSLMPWRYLFLLPLPLCLLCLLLSRGSGFASSITCRRFDLGGYTLIMSVSFACLMLFTPAGQCLLPSYEIQLAALPVIGLAVLCLRYLRPRERILQFSLLYPRSYRVSLLGNVLVRVFLSSAPLMLSLLLQTRDRDPMISASLALTIFSLGALAARTFNTGMLVRFGYSRLLIAMCVLTSFLLVSLSLLSSTTPMSLILALAFALGLSSSLLYSSLNTLAFHDLNDDSFGAGNSMLTLAQLMSMICGISLSFSLLHAQETWVFAALGQGYDQVFRLMGCGLLLSATLFTRLDRSVGVSGSPLRQSH